MQNDSVLDSPLIGLITEADLDIAEAEFPGIARFYARCPERPHTFLDLIVRFGAFEDERLRCAA